ncbi:hypothetical protein OAZ08_02055 [Candidatus Pelagibacter sp.]|nr:hypothetical protein [Candidatus Pelagibacter sp.]
MKHKFLFSVFIIFFIFVFIALGTWQIIRLNWKNNLILEIENSLKNPPVQLSHLFCLQFSIHFFSNPSFLTAPIPTAVCGSTTI